MKLLSLGTDHYDDDDNKVCVSVFEDVGDRNCQNSSDALRIQFGAWFFF